MSKVKINRDTWRFGPTNTLAPSNARECVDWLFTLWMPLLHPFRPIKHQSLHNMGRNPCHMYINSEYCFIIVLVIVAFAPQILQEHGMCKGDHKGTVFESVFAYSDHQSLFFCPFHASVKHNSAVQQQPAGKRTPQSNNHLSSFLYELLMKPHCLVCILKTREWGFTCKVSREMSSCLWFVYLFEGVWLREHAEAFAQHTSQ